MKQIAQRIREIPDFPIEGVIFRDIAPLLGDPAALRLAVEELARPFVGDPPEAVAGLDARGFIFGVLVAQYFDVAFVPLRKPGKLPFNTISASYDLEYGSAALEAHVDAVAPKTKVLIVDDLIATGGTAAASCELIERLDAQVIGVTVVVELEELGGRAKLEGHQVHSVLRF